jgi:hypothetical protein
MLAGLRTLIHAAWGPDRYGASTRFERDAFSTELAGVGEHKRALLDAMLIEHDAGVGDGSARERHLDAPARQRGTMTVGDGARSASILLVGNYSLASFNLGAETGGSCTVVPHSSRTCCSGQRRPDHPKRLLRKFKALLIPLP